MDSIEEEMSTYITTVLKLIHFTTCGRPSSSISKGDVVCDNKETEGSMTSA